MLDRSTADLNIRFVRADGLGRMVLKLSPRKLLVTWFTKGEWLAIAEDPEKVAFAAGVLGVTRGELIVALDDLGQSERSVKG